MKTLRDELNESERIVVATIAIYLFIMSIGLWNLIGAIGQATK